MLPRMDIHRTCLSPELATPSSPLELCTRNGMCSVVAVQQDERIVAGFQNERIVCMVFFCKSRMVDGGVQWRGDYGG